MRPIKALEHDTVTGCNRILNYLFDFFEKDAYLLFTKIIETRYKMERKGYYTQIKHVVMVMQIFNILVLQKQEGLICGRNLGQPGFSRKFSH